MFPRRKKQHGSMILIAVFVIVVMGLLTVNLSRIQWSNQDTLAREVLGTQAWFTAQSGTEWALTVLFPLNEAGTLSELNDNCDAVNNQAASAASDLVSGLPCLSPTIQCSKPASTLPDTLKYYRVTSSTICSSGSIFQVQRDQEVWVRAIEE